jgi:hypothetical protein
MESAARELRGVLIQELQQLEKITTYDKLRTQVDDIAVMLAKRMRDAIIDDMDFAFKNGYSSAYGEIKGIRKTAAKAPDPKAEDIDVLRLLKNEGALYNAYAQFQSILTDKLNQTIMAGISQGSSIPEIVQNMRQVGIGETYKLTRIARTEIMLQQEIGAKYRMNLRGHSLLHPNQRTQLVRIV